MTPCNSSTFRFARPNVPSCRERCQSVKVDCYVCVSKSEIHAFQELSSLDSRKIKRPLISQLFGGVGNTYPLLRQFSCSLILAIPQQFNDSSLVRCKASDFFDNFTDESGTFREMTFGAGNAGLSFDGCRFLLRRLCQQEEV